MSACHIVLSVCLSARQSKSKSICLSVCLSEINDPCARTYPTQEEKASRSFLSGKIESNHICCFDFMRMLYIRFGGRYGAI